jgi:serine protease Do
MRQFLAVVIILLPLVAASAAPEQAPSFDPSTGSFGFSTDDFPGGGSYLGVDTRDITPDRVSALKLKGESGVEVTMVDQDAPAGKAGLKEHDVILTLNGNKVESVEQLRRMIREVPSGRTVTLGVSRSGQPMSMQVQLADRSKFMAQHGFRPPKAFKVEVPTMPVMPNVPELDMPVSVVVVHSSMRSGLMVENLTPQLGEFFGAKNGHGVLVRSVEKGSRAEKAGFRAGDVIVRVESEPVQDSSDFSHSLQSHRGGNVTVGIIRDKKEQTVTLSIPERKTSGELLDEESFEFPEINLQAHLGDINTQLAFVKPQIAVKVKTATDAAREAQKALCEQQKELQHEHEKLQKEMREQQHHLRNEIDKDRRELLRELRQLQSTSEI